jgi:hypothetical protein
VQGAKIGLRPVSALLPHEETIPPKTEKLVAEMAKEGIQRDPLIVDNDSGTVLDGMHRLSAFKKLKLEYAVCHLVDYSSHSISLQRWVRVYQVRRPELVPPMLDGLGLNRRTTLSDAFDLVENRKAALAVMDSSGCRVGPAGGSVLSQSFSLVRQLDSVFSTLGWTTSFAAEDEIDIVMQDPKNLVAIIPRLTKQDVLTAAQTGQLFPWKTSMHIVDPRPVAIDFPLKALVARAPPTAELESKMKEGRPKMLPPNSLYKGRRYKERLLVLCS